MTSVNRTYYCGQCEEWIRYGAPHGCPGAREPLPFLSWADGEATAWRPEKPTRVAFEHEFFVMLVPVPSPETVASLAACATKESVVRSTLFWVRSMIGPVPDPRDARILELEADVARLKRHRLILTAWMRMFRAAFDRWSVIDRGTKICFPAIRREWTRWPGHGARWVAAKMKGTR